MQRFSGFDASTQCIPRRPPARWILQRAHIVKGVLIRIKGRISPNRFQLGGTLAGGDAAICEIHTGPIVWATLGDRIDFQTVGAGHVEHPLMAFAIGFPAFDDLNPL